MGSNFRVHVLGSLWPHTAVFLPIRSFVDFPRQMRGRFFHSFLGACDDILWTVQSPTTPLHPFSTFQLLIHILKNLVSPSR